MKPIEFKKANVTFARSQPEYLPLPAWRSEGKGKVVSCWQVNWRERLKLLFTGKIWLSILTFGKPLQPQKLDVDYPDFEERRL